MSIRKGMLVITSLAVLLMASGCGDENDPHMGLADTTVSLSDGGAFERQHVIIPQLDGDAPSPAKDASSPAKDASSKPPSPPPPPPPSSPAGYWLLWKRMDGGKVTFTVTDADMVKKVGSTGWPGCPNGIICTRYGIWKLALGAASKKLHYMRNVKTSSDYQQVGTYTFKNKLVTYQRKETFSCAHPSPTSAAPKTLYFRYKFAGKNVLWTTSFSTNVPLAAPTKWAIYRRISKQSYYSKYMIRICQAKLGMTCNPGCFSNSLVD
jgi:hypothetical protein